MHRLKSAFRERSATVVVTSDVRVLNDTLAAAYLRPLVGSLLDAFTAHAGPPESESYRAGRICA